MMRRATVLALIRASCAGASARAAELVPVLDASLLLGQVFQEGKSSSWQGNATLQATPAVKFNDHWGLIPTYAASYQGTKSVTDLGSGGQLFQDSMSHSLSLKGIWRGDKLKVKPTLGYRWEFLRETTDESWGKGLFDYRKPSAGVEADYAFADRVKAGLALDWYKIDFPNYVELEASQNGTALGRENADGHSLNSNNLSWTLTGELPLPFEGGLARVQFNTTSRFYGQQHVVLESGELSAQRRTDGFRSATGTLYYGRTFTPEIAGLLSLQLALTRARSDQNHYDPELNVFSRDYYSFDERTISPRLTMVLGKKKVELSAAYLLIDRDYTGRQAQDAAGGYIGQAISLHQESYLLDLSVPIKHGFKLIAHTALTTSSSNMAYEKTFKYNYTLSSHLVGVSYSY